MAPKHKATARNAASAIDRTRKRRAVQYLRMSSDGQKYSLQNQAAVIREFAEVHGYEVVRSFEDAGKSGVTAKGRAGLASLLAEVVKGDADFSTILVLDVSRWGRYQDPDEAAHYEFLCRNSGVEVRYCAERFGDDFSSPIMKQLKRVMAGEYSRELSIKVQRGKRRHIEQGHAPGGACPFGLQREEVLPDGSSGRVLQRWERKSRPEMSVRFIPGLQAERVIVREVFRSYLRSHLAPAAIASRLNAKGSTWHDGTAWSGQRIERMLRCELLAGRQVTGKCINRMGQTRRALPKQAWELVRTFEPVVAPAIFDAAQRRITALNGSSGKTDAEMLGDLRTILRRHGRVSIRLIEQVVGKGKSSVYFSRFGSLSNAYAQIGYRQSHVRRGNDCTGLLMSPSSMLKGLIELARSNGRVTVAALRSAPHLPSTHIYRRTFGSIALAYQKAGLTKDGKLSGHFELSGDEMRFAEQ